MSREAGSSGTSPINCEVWTDNITVHAESLDGGNNRKDPDPATAINLGLSEMTEGTLFVKNSGTVYTINSPILINKDRTILRSNGARLIQGNQLNIDMI